MDDIWKERFKQYMRICYVAYQFWPSVGGSQTQAEKQAGYLSQLGQEVLVVTLRHQRAWPASEMYRSFSVIRVGGWYRRSGTLRAGRFGYLLVNVLMFLTLWRLRQRYDLIHTLQLSPQAAVAALIGKLAHKPVILGVQSTGPYEASGETHAMLRDKHERGTAHREAELGGDLAQLQRTAWGGRMMLDYLRKADVYYQILSSRSYQYLQEHRFRPERIIYIPNGVDTQLFYPVSWTRPDDFSFVWRGWNMPRE
jgi:glycosyltransferase involved in cell wall biosynthesis